MTPSTIPDPLGQQKNPCNQLVNKGFLKAGEGVRTLDIHVGNLSNHDHSDSENTSDLSDDIGDRSTIAANRLTTEAAGDPDLARLIRVWSDLPTTLRNAIIAIAEINGKGIGE